MADVQFNIVKGKFNSYFERVANNDPINSRLVLVLLKTSQTEADLKQHETLAALLAAANTEADFTGYVRKYYTDSEITDSVVDHGAGTNSASLSNPVWTGAGGAVNNGLYKLILCYEEDSTAADDSLVIPMGAYDFVATTNGNNLTGLAGVVYIAN